jgi:hypothetical protein
MCSNIENLRKELDSDNLLPTLSSSPLQLEDSRCGSDMILAPLKRLLFLVTKGDPGS